MFQVNKGCANKAQMKTRGLRGKANSSYRVTPFESGWQSKEKKET